MWFWGSPLVFMVWNSGATYQNHHKRDSSHRQVNDPILQERRHVNFNFNRLDHWSLSWPEWVQLVRTRAEVSPNRGRLSRPLLVPYVLVLNSSMAAAAAASSRLSSTASWALRVGACSNRRTRTSRTLQAGETASVRQTEFQVKCLTQSPPEPFPEFMFTSCFYFRVKLLTSVVQQWSFCCFSWIIRFKKNRKDAAEKSVFSVLLPLFYKKNHKQFWVDGDETKEEVQIRATFIKLKVGFCSVFTRSTEDWELNGSFVIRWAAGRKHGCCKRSVDPHLTERFWFITALAGFLHFHLVLKVQPLIPDTEQANIRHHEGPDSKIWRKLPDLQSEQTVMQTLKKMKQNDLWQQVLLLLSLIKILNFWLFCCFINSRCCLNVSLIHLFVHISDFHKAKSSDTHWGAFPPSVHETTARKETKLPPSFVSRKQRTGKTRESLWSREAWRNIPAALWCFLRSDHVGFTCGGGRDANGTLRWRSRLGREGDQCGGFYTG